MGLTKVTFSMINGAVVNVLDYGADPTGVNDSSAAIQAAIDSNTSFIEVFIPPGDYKLNNPIVINRQNLTLKGAGYQTALLPVAGVIAIQVARDSGVSRLNLEDFRIYGLTDANGGIELGGAVTGSFVAFCKLKGITITNFTEYLGYGVKLNKVQELDIDGCYIADNYNNIHFPASANNYATTVHIHGQSGYIGRALNIGILLDKEVASLRVSDIVVEANVGPGLACTGFSNQVTFDNVHFESNGNAMYLSGNVNRKGQFTINNCFFYGNTLNLSADHAYIMATNNVGFVETGKILPLTGCNLFFQNNKADDVVSTNVISKYEALRASGPVSYIDKDDSGNFYERVSQIYLGTGSAALYSGAGSPENVVTAVVGSLYLRTDGGAGTTLYVKQSGVGSTGWAAK